MFRQGGYSGIHTVPLQFVPEPPQGTLLETVTLQVTLKSVLDIAWAYRPRGGGGARKD